jgi:hypothetical protein
MKEAGWPRMRIQEHGTGTSDCYKRYLERSADEHMEALRGLHQDLMECRRGNGCSKARAGRERGEGAKTRSRRMRRKRRINGKTSRGQRCG